MNKILNLIFLLPIFTYSQTSTFLNATSTAGDMNVISGYQGGNQTNSGDAHVYYGTYAGRGVQINENTNAADSRENTFFGSAAGYYTTSSYNTFIGYSSGINNKTGQYNTSIGSNSGTNVTGDHNTLIGRNSDSKGSYNTYIGNISPPTASNNNVIIGKNSLTSSSNILLFSQQLYPTPDLIFGNFTTNQVAIGGNVLPTDTEYKLAVAEGIICNGFLIKNHEHWPDYVFEGNYDLKTLDEVETYIKKNNHLENIPSQQEVLKDGYDLNTMDVLLLEKIEELTLYTIEQNKRIEAIENLLENE